MKTIMVISLAIVAIQYLIVIISCYKYLPKNSTISHLWEQMKDCSIWVWVPFVGLILWLIYIINSTLKGIFRFIKNVRIK